MLTSLFSEAPQLLLLNQKSSDALFSLKCWHHSLYISFFFSKDKHDILKHVCCFPAKYGNVAQIAAWRSTRGTPWIEVKWKLRCVGGGRVVHVCRDAQLIVVLLWAVGIFLIVAEFSMRFDGGVATQSTRRGWHVLRWCEKIVKSSGKMLKFSELWLAGLKSVPSYI